MGRYYTGQISGKFWFGIQDSTDADFFGRPYKDNFYFHVCGCAVPKESIHDKVYCKTCFSSYEKHCKAIALKPEDQTWYVSDADVSYEFDQSDIPYIRTKLEELEEIVGCHMENLRIVERGGSVEYRYPLPGEIRADHMSLVARFCLGKQILYCLEKYGTCAFAADL